METSFRLVPHNAAIISKARNLTAFGNEMMSNSFETGNRLKDAEGQEVFHSPTIEQHALVFPQEKQGSFKGYGIVLCKFRRAWTGGLGLKDRAHVVPA